MNRSVLIAFVALFLALAVTAGFFLMRPDPLAQRVQQLEVELARLQEQGTPARKAPEAASLPAAPATAASRITKAPTPQIEPGATAEMVKQMTSDPDKRDTLQKQQAAQVEIAYGKLFQKLHLNPEEEANLKQLLSNRLSALMDISMKAALPNITLDQRKGMSEQMGVAKTASDELIRKFLNNDDDFKTFQAWEDTRPEHTKLQIAGSKFDQAGVPLSEEQQDQLVNLMAEARKNPVYNDPRNISAQSLTVSGIAKQLAVQDANDAAVEKEAASFLTPPQLGALKSMHQQLRTLAEAGMKTSGQMLGTVK